MLVDIRSLASSFFPLFILSNKIKDDYFCVVEQLGFEVDVLVKLEKLKTLTLCFNVVLYLSSIAWAGYKALL
jgi:hypothetical protein